MKKFYEIGKYQQIVYDTGECSCTCIWTTMEISRHPKDWENRKLCKHIKEIYNLKKEEKNDKEALF